MIRAVGEYIVVKLPPKTEKSAGGIILQETEKPTTGDAISCGDSVKHIPEGATVLFSQFAGTPIGDNRIILKESEVYGIVQ